MLKKIISISVMLALTGCASTKDANKKVEFSKSDIIQLKFKDNGQTNESVLSNLKEVSWRFTTDGSIKRRYKGGWSFTNNNFKYDSKGCQDNDFGGCNPFAKESFVQVTGELNSKNKGDIVNINLIPKNYVEYKSTDLFGKEHAPKLSGNTPYSGNRYALLASLAAKMISVKEEIDSEYAPESIIANIKRLSSYENSNQDFNIRKIKGNSYLLITKSGAKIDLKVEVFSYRKGSKSIFIANIRPVVTGNNVDFYTALSEFKSSISTIVKS